jgi:Gluconate 2-dehydrogenase subunit 3
MNRRDALSRVALLLGGTLSAPTLFAMNKYEKLPETTKHIYYFDDAQQAIIAEIAELIIPTTKTPGAKAAGVPAFIALMLQDCYKQPEQESFAAGIADIVAKSQALGGSFVSLSNEQKTSILKTVETETKELMKSFNVKNIKVGDNVDKEKMDNTKKQAVPFWRIMKELTLFGYFTSEIGCTQALEYVEVPGKLEATKIKKGTKAWAI